MNAAARLVNQQFISRTWLLNVFFKKSQLFMATLSVFVLVSALSVVYATNSSRALYATLQQLSSEYNDLHLRENQLLLEKSTWASQARIERTATLYLNMGFPDRHSTVIIRG